MGPEAGNTADVAHRVPVARAPLDRPFTLTGTAAALDRATLAVLGKAAPDAQAHQPTRPMGGWATTYGKVTSTGEVVPTVDRDEQIMECARAAGLIDWTGYLRQGRGFWNDTHRGGRPGDRAFKVGIGTSLEFHGPSSALARAHGKMGWWTAGHLWDRNDPDSWRLYTTYQPTSADLDRADHFWGLATNELALADRPLGFSVDGLMQLSPCKRRILKAWISELALAVGPRNADCTAEPLLKAALPSADPLLWLRPERVGVESLPAACRTCACPAGACGLVRKAAETSPGVAVPRPLIPPPRAGRSTAPVREEPSMPLPFPTSDLQAALEQLNDAATPGAPSLPGALNELNKAAQGDEPEEDMEDEDTGDEDSEETEDENTGDEDSVDEEPAEKGGDYGNPDDGMDDEELQKAAEEILSDLLGGVRDVVRDEISSAFGTVGPLGKAASDDMEAMRGELAELRKDNSKLRAQLKGLNKAVASLSGLPEQVSAMAKGVAMGLEAISKALPAAPLVRPGPSVAEQNAAAARLAAGGPANDARAQTLAKADELFAAGRLTPQQIQLIKASPDPVTLLKNFVSTSPA